MYRFNKIAVNANEREGSLSKIVHYHLKDFYDYHS